MSGRRPVEHPPPALTTLCHGTSSGQEAIAHPTAMTSASSAPGTNEGGPDPRDPTGQTPLLPIVQDSYGLVDAWVAWLSPSAKWRFAINGKNLTDEEYLTNGYNLPVLGSIQGSYGMPRTFVGTVEYRFW